MRETTLIRADIIKIPFTDGLFIISYGQHPISKVFSKISSTLSRG